MQSDGSRAPSLPPEFCPRRLAANLAALASVDQKLAARLALSVGSEHVECLRGGGLEMRWRGSNLGLELGTNAPGVWLREGREATAPGLILGVGCGEPIAAAMAREPGRTWIAWERDPWILRLFLMRIDVSRVLRERRLALALGADLFAAARTALAGPLVAHTVLGAVYPRERRIAEVPDSGEAVLLAEGGLFVDQLGEALARRGFTPYTLDLERLAEGELDHAVFASRARRLFAINYTHGLAEFAARHGLDACVWEIDPSLDTLQPLAVASGGTRVFTYRAAHVPIFEAAGFERVEHLPLAADTLARQPVALAPDQAARYQAPVAFVGSSMAPQAARNRRVFLDLCAAARGAASRPKEAARLNALLDRQRARPDVYLLAEWLERVYGDVLDLARAHGPACDPARLLEDVAASEKRLLLVGALGSRGIEVWGDGGWADLTEFGVVYRGPAGHQRELNAIYSGGGIQLDINRIYQPDIATMRVFDVLACGGFCLAEHNAELDRLFDVGNEIAVYHNPAELIAKVDHYLAHPAEARAIAARGHAAVQARHTIDMRLDRLLRTQITQLEGLRAG